MSRYGDPLDADGKVTDPTYLGWVPLAIRVMRSLHPIIEDAIGERLPSAYGHGYGWECSVLVPIELEMGPSIVKDADLIAVRPVPEKSGALPPLLPGTRLLVVDGTNGHMMWPPAVMVARCLNGSHEGRTVEFVCDPDNRPAGPLGGACGLMLVRTDHPLLADSTALAQLAGAVSAAIAIEERHERGDLPAPPSVVPPAVSDFPE